MDNGRHTEAWDQELRDWVLAPTGQEYAKVPLTSLTEDRGLGDPFLVRLLADLPLRTYVAGGCMAYFIGGKDYLADIDIFAGDWAAYTMMLAILTREDTYGYREAPVYPGSKNQVITLTCPNKPTIQLIKTIWYPSLESLVDSFDWTVTQIATDGTDVVMHPMAALDLARKRLVLHRLTFPVSTMRRLVKYTKAGFYACPGSLARLVEALRLSTPEHDQIHYVD